MEQIIFKPSLYKYGTCREFAEGFQLKETDLILTNEYIYAPHFGELDLPCHVVYQEKYGMGEPSDVMAEAILKDISGLHYERIIAIGGGTIIDLAKVFAVADTQDMDELYARMPALNKAHELVIIPTTCGTGSEVTNIAVLNRTRMGTKMGMVAPTMYADYAVLIPELLEGLPLKVFATSSIDALVHAVESALSPKATDYTRMFSYGNVQFDTIRMMDNEIDPIIAKSAKKVIVSVEEIVPEEEIIRTPTMTLLPKIFTDQVVYAPFGSHPNSCDTRYDFDLKHGEYYAECAKSDAGFAEYLNEYIYGTADEAAYIEKVGGLQALQASLGHGGTDE